MKPVAQRLIKAFSDAIPLDDPLHPPPEFVPVRLDFVQDAVTELRRLHQHEQANKVWLDKTEWVQDNVQPGEPGMHRADCLKQRIERLQASNTELLTSLQAMVKEVERRAKVSGTLGTLKDVTGQAIALITKTTGGK